MSRTLRRVWLLINIVVTVALFPALLPNHHGGSGVAVAAGAASFESSAPPSTMVVPTTTTTALVAPKLELAAAKTTPKPKATTTTTTAKPRLKPVVAHTPTTVAHAQPASAAPHGSETGKATWYDYQPGICAHRTLPFGTVVTVHAVNGRSVQCTVGDRGPFVDGYVIDLNSREYSQLAPTSTGRIDCTITW